MAVSMLTLMVMTARRGCRSDPRPRHHRRGHQQNDRDDREPAYRWFRPAACGMSGGRSPV